MRRANSFTALLVVCGVTLFLCIAGVLFINIWDMLARATETTSPAIQLPSGDSAAAPTHTPTPQLALPRDDAAIVLDEGQQSTTIHLPPPTFLSINEQTLPIQPETISGADLLGNHPAGDVRWVRNTFINYVLQLPSTAANQQLLQNLMVGDSIQLSTAAGDTKVFTVSSVAQIAPNNIILKQTEPSITLIWSGENPLIVYGRYADLEGQPLVEATPPPTAVWTDDEYVTLQKGGLSQDGASLLLAGEIHNTSTTMLTFQESDLLLTGQGQLYPILEASPPLPWHVPPGETLSFLLRAQRPDGLEAIIQIRNQAFSLQNLQ